MKTKQVKFTLKKKKHAFCFKHKELTSFINTGQHQEVCQYFINLNLVKKKIMKWLKWKENASVMSLAGFSDLSTSEDGQSHYHFELLLRRLAGSPGGTLSLTTERHKIGFWFINHITWKWLARFSASLKNMFANVFIKIQTTRHTNYSTWVALERWGTLRFSIISLAKGLANLSCKWVR